MPELRPVDSGNMGLSGRGPRDARLPFSLGAIAIGAQLILMREFCVQFSGNELSYGILLACWLLAVGTGSLAADRMKIGSGSLAPWFSAILLLPALGLAGLRLSRFLLGTLPGQIPGPGAMLISALLLSALAGIPMGGLFVILTRRLGGDLPHVYLFESLGAAAGGGFMRFLLIPFMSNWQAYAVLAGTLGLVLCLFRKRRPSPRYWVPAAIGLVLIGLTDLPLQKWVWAPLRLVASKDTRYGRLQVIQNREQICLYRNGTRVFSVPEPAADEEAVHFAMLQNPEAVNVLLVGSAGGGMLREILKYPVRTIDVIDIDPAENPFVIGFLPESSARHFGDRRVRFHHADGRAWLIKTDRRYDAVLLNPGSPDSARANRYFTKEFFARVQTRLRSGGIFFFRSFGSEAYISPVLAEALASLLNTLRSQFSHTGVVPGDSCVFLAGENPIELEAGELTRRIEHLGLNIRLLTSGQIEDRLDPLRRRQLENRLQGVHGPVNSDLRPVGFLFNILRWTARSKGPEFRFLRAAMRCPRPLFFELPLVLTGGLMLILLGFRRRRTAAVAMLPLFLMGATTIVTEILVILAFQISHGSLYTEVALLFSVFMLGLSLGAWFGRRHGSPERQLPLLQATLLVLILLLRFGLRGHPASGYFYIFLTTLGIVNGWLFLAANRLYLRHRAYFGLGYGLDLVGSFAGALGTASLLIPLFGMVPIVNALVVLNAMTWAYLKIGFRLAGK